MRTFFTTIVSSLLFLSLAVNDSSTVAEQVENPYIILAKVKNSSGVHIDGYVNTILEHTDITADMILQKAKDTDSWLYKEFIKDAVYMGRVSKVHTALRKMYSDEDLQIDKNFDDLKAKFPHYARVLPIFSSVDTR